MIIDPKKILVDKRKLLKKEDILVQATRTSTSIDKHNPGDDDSSTGGIGTRHTCKRYLVGTVRYYSIPKHPYKAQKSKNLLCRKRANVRDARSKRSLGKVAIKKREKEY